MIPPKVDESLKLLASSSLDGRIARETLAAFFLSRGRDPAAVLPLDAKSAADTLEHSLPGLTRSQNGSTSLAELFNDSRGEVLFLWCEQSVERSDVKMAPLLAAALRSREFA